MDAAPRSSSLTPSEARPSVGQVAAPATAAPASPEERDLLATLHADPISAQRRRAIDRYAPSDDVAPLLMAASSDNDPIVRRWAALALERKATHDMSPALRQAAAAEPNPVVRQVLERALRRAERDADLALSR